MQLNFLSVCPVVIVTYGYNHGEPVHGMDADACVDSFADLGSSAGLWGPVRLGQRSAKREADLTSPNSLLCSKNVPING